MNAIKPKLIEALVSAAPAIASIRRDLHAHPELCFEEVRTADVVAQKLTEWGIPIHRGMGTTGVVGIGKNGTSGRASGRPAHRHALPMTASHPLGPAAHPALVRPLVGAIAMAGLLQRHEKPAANAWTSTPCTNATISSR